MDFFKENNIDLPTIESADAMENPTAVAKFTNNNWCWFVIGGKPLANGDFYLYGLVNGYEKEIGMFTLKQILDVGAELDADFTPIGIFDIYDDFDLRYNNWWCYLMVLKNIKVTENVKSDLDAIAYEKETYNVTINRLIRENERLKLENYRLHYDKKVLTKLLLNNESISDIDAELKFVPFIESVLFDSDLPDDEKFDTLKRYFFEIVDADVDLIKSCVGIVKETHSVSDGALIEFESYINNSII